jgi:hypothetical protein
MPEPVVQWLGIDPRNGRAEQGRNQNHSHEEKWNSLHRLARARENGEQRDHDKLMGQVDLVAALAEFAQRRKDTWGSPVRLSGSSDEHARANRKHGHVQPNATQMPLVRGNRETQDENDHGRSGACAYDEKRTRKPEAFQGESSKAAERNGVHPTEIGVFPPDGIRIEGAGACKGAEDDEHQKRHQQIPIATEEPAREREEKVEHFFDRERPENVPSCRAGSFCGLRAS